MSCAQTKTPNKNSIKPLKNNRKLEKTPKRKGPAKAPYVASELRCVKQPRRSKCAALREEPSESRPLRHVRRSGAFAVMLLAGSVGAVGLGRRMPMPWGAGLKGVWEQRRFVVF